MQTSESTAPKGKVRGFVTFFLLHLVTLGAYHAYWWHAVASEVNAFLGTNRMSAAKILLLSPLTLGLYMVIWQFGEGRKIIREVQARAGCSPQVPFVAAPWQFQSALNKAWRALPA